MPDDHDEAVEELLQLVHELYPNEVDVFEDDLAARLGIARHPTLSYEDWRPIRVQAINAEDPLADCP